MSKRSLQGAQSAFHAKLSHTNIGNMAFSEVTELGGWLLTAGLFFPNLTHLISRVNITHIRDESLRLMPQ